MKKLITGMAFLLLTTFVACRKQAADTAVNTYDPQLFKTLLSAGIPESEIVEQEEYYIVWDQLRFKKGKTNLEQVRAWFAKTGKSVAQEEQTRHLLLMNSEVVQSIRVYANVPYDWDYVTRKAMQDWATIPNCKINFYYVTFTEAAGLGDVQVLPDGGMLNAGIPVLTEFPSGTTGWKIWVNSDVYTTAPGNQVPVADRPSAMRYDMAHAFGYTLGFLPPGAPGGIQIPGTPVADAASVMDPNGFHLWNGFSTYDIVAAQYLYPYNALDKWITSIQEDFDADDLAPLAGYSGFDITWDASLVNTPTVTLELYQHRNYLGTLASTIPNTGHFSFTEDNFNAFFPPAKQSGVQIRIINDTKEWETDFSAMFYINWE